MQDGQYIESFRQGFNEGYLIAQHMPELSENLAKIKNDSPRMSGIHAGRDEFLQEKTKERIPDPSARDSSSPRKKEGRDMEKE